MIIYHSAVSRTTFPSLAHETSLKIYCWSGEAKEALSPWDEEKRFIENQVSLFLLPQGSFSKFTRKKELMCFPYLNDTMAKIQIEKQIPGMRGTDASSSSSQLSTWPSYVIYSLKSSYRTSERWERQEDKKNTLHPKTP